MLTHTITSTITTHQCCGSGQHIFSISGSDHIMKKRIPLLSSIAEPTHFRAPSPFWRLLERRIYIPSKFLIKHRNIQTGNNEQYELRFKDKKIKPFMFLTKKLKLEFYESEQNLFLIYPAFLAPRFFCLNRLTF